MKHNFMVGSSHVARFMPGWLVPPIFWLVAFLLPLPAGQPPQVTHSPTMVKATAMPPGELPGLRPYEMVRANRRPPQSPLVSFDSLDGWTLELQNGAAGELYASQKQRVWDSPVARLIYHGESPQSATVLRPPKPIPIPVPVSAATIWVYGNNWAWVPDSTTPQVTLSLLIRDRSGAEHEVEIVKKLGWKEWWLVHHVLPQDVLGKSPLYFAGLRVSGCANRDDRELYFEDLAFFQESFKPLSFSVRPRRGVDPFAGQDPGANHGPDRLPFPTREETILPENLTASFRTRLNRVSGQSAGFEFLYDGADARLSYQVQPADDGWGRVAVTLNGSRVAQALVGAGPVFQEGLKSLRLLHTEANGNSLHAAWEGSLGEKKILFESTLRLWQKSLVVDYICRGGLATELSYGRIDGVEAPGLILIPYLNYGSHHLNVMMSRGSRPFFASVWMDWYRSNASAPYAEDKMTGDQVRLNGGVRYLPRTDGKRNDMYERVFVTFSPSFEETLPTIPNPPARWGREAATRLWQESWGPENYEREHERSRLLRGYGIDMLTQCNHEITWRDGGESFTFRTMAAPGKGGDEALRRYVEQQRSLGWRSGLYTNYTDFAPVNEYWDIDRVMRSSSGQLVTAWPRCYSPKALFAVEMDRKLAPLIQKKFNSNAAYTDVHTSVSPWERTDYDARVPGAGTFAATFYAYGEILLHDQEVYDGHCWSEGHHQWLYAGLATGNYGLTYSGLHLWEYPYLPHFDLMKMHPLSVDIGMPWTAQFFSGKAGWDKPENIVTSIDQFIAATIAYGHIGWLVEESHGIRQACRSYYMLQQLQSRYAMRKPLEIRYGTANGTVDSSEALLNDQWKDSRLLVRYPDSLEIWVNGNAATSWEVSHGGVRHVLPPYGWLAVQGNEFYEGSELADGRRYDYVSSPDYVFLDGRGSGREFHGIATSGSLVVQRGEKGNDLSLIAVEGVDDITITRPARDYGDKDIRSTIGRVAGAKTISTHALDLEGKDLGIVEALKVPSGWKIPVRPKAIRYDIHVE